MTEQRYHNPLRDTLQLNGAGDGASAGAERLTAARAAFDRLYSAADAMLEQIRQSDSERFLRQVRQSGGQ